MNDVTLIGIPNYDWTSLIEVTNLAPRPPIRKIDAEHEKPSLKAYLAMLSLLKNPNQSVSDSIIFSKASQEHLFFTFAIISNMDTFWMLSQNLRILFTDTVGQQHLFIVSASLKDWHQASIDSCSKQAAPEFRKLINKVVLLLEGAGFGLIWRDVKKVMQPDDTFTLEKA